MKIVILGAGLGSRLGDRPLPKPLTQLGNGCTILQFQLKNLSRYVEIDDVMAVVGFKKELVMEAHAELLYCYNDYYDTTNTAKSLAKALRKIKCNDVLWINGDVVFDHQILQRVIATDRSCMAVNTEHVGEEEIKYLVDNTGAISQVSKTVAGALGEAVGINKIIAADLELLKSCLEQCSNTDYFERGIELAIRKGLRIYPVDVSGLKCVEVDFPEDLEHANTLFSLYPLSEEAQQQRR